MAGVGLRSLVACLILLIRIHTFYQNIHALENHTTPFTAVTTRLRIGVQWKTLYTEFVSVGENKTNITGFCVEVFKAAVENLNYRVDFIVFGDGRTDPPSYNTLIPLIVQKKLDAVVGDLTITANRSQEVQFTQPFLDSTPVAVVRLKNEGFISSGLNFMKPFSTELWLLTAAFLFCGGLAVYLLERRSNPRFQGQPTKQIRNILLFSFSTWFPNQEDTRSIMGRTVVAACLVVTGTLYSCYTANLSAILTAPRLEPTLKDFNSVVASNVKIGYWNNSFMRDFLMRDLRIAKHRLIPLSNKADYYNDLSSGRMDAIVDEGPYMESLVANHCSELALAGQPFMTLNWGFAFDPIHHGLLATNISGRILKLRESGKLYRIQRHWLPYSGRDCSKHANSESSQLHVRQFWGLFALSGLVIVIALLLFIMQSRCKTQASPRSRFIRPWRRPYRRRVSGRPRTYNSENSVSDETKSPDANASERLHHLASSQHCSVVYPCP